MSLEVMALGDVVDVFSGYAWKAADFKKSEPGIPIIRIQNVGNSKSDFVYWDSDYADRFLISEGDILLSLSGSFRVAKWLGPRALLNQRVVKLTPCSELDAGYFLHFMGGKLREIEAMGRHALVNNVSVGDLKKIKIPLPPLPEQRRIAAILDKADALRAKRREAIAKCDQLLQSVFLDMFGDVSKNDQGWPELQFGDLVESTKLGLVRSAKEFGRTAEFDVPYVRMDAVGRNGEFFEDKVQKTCASHKEIADSSLMHGDFLFNTRNSRELVGKSTVYQGVPGWVFNNNLMRIRFHKDTANGFYVLWYLLSPHGQQELESRKSGTTNVFAVYYKALKTLPVVCPPIELQNAFQGKLEAIAKHAKRQKTQLSALDVQFASIQQMAFSGRLSQAA